MVCDSLINMHVYQYVIFDTQAAGGMPNGDHRQSQHPGQHTQQRMSQGGDMSAHRQSEFNDPPGKILNIMLSIGHVNEHSTTNFFVNSRHTQSKIAYQILTEYLWKISVKIALWECC